ncbi:MAG: class I SAM-dependent methyltransferase [Bacteroidia bacterium]|nr:class I SAM-dependent methyltransferase [Bacteroidia bacterium]
MSFKLKVIRKFKANFMRFKMHGVFGPFENFMINMGNLSRLSRWRKNNSNLKFNDFYLSKWDYMKRFALYEFIIKEENLGQAVNYLEYGVAAGRSFKWWVENNKHADSRFYGFDTFTGLPEDWNMFKAGAMSTGGVLPDVKDDRAFFVKGMFQDSLPDFLLSFKDDKRKIIHLDADLYSSTLYVLAKLHPLLKKNDVILFDEFAVPQSEFLAFTNFVNAFRFEYEVIAAANNYMFVAMKVK